MAEINVERKPAGNYTWALVALSLVLIAGFFWWLSVNAEPTSGPVVQEDPEEEQLEAGVSAVTLAQLQGADSLLGRAVQVRDMPVGSRMGTQAFWTQLPDQNAFLVKLPAGEQVTSGERVTVTGAVVQMTDSVLSAWEQSGAIQDEIERAEAEFAQLFIEASRVRHAAGARSGQGQSGGAQQPPGQ